MFREIPSPGNSRRPACPAFAETLAVISRLTSGPAISVLVTRVGIPRRGLAERQDVRRPIHPGATHDDELLAAAACLFPLLQLQASLPFHTGAATTIEDCTTQNHTLFRPSDVYGTI